MFAEPFEAKDGYRIWLDLDETDELLATASSFLNPSTKQCRLRDLHRSNDCGQVPCDIRNWVDPFNDGGSLENREVRELSLHSTNKTMNNWLALVNTESRWPHELPVPREPLYGGRQHAVWGVSIYPYKPPEGSHITWQRPFSDQFDGAFP
jgi:hypothetical protein